MTTMRSRARIRLRFAALAVALATTAAACGNGRSIQEAGYPKTVPPTPAPTLPPTTLAPGETAAPTTSTVPETTTTAPLDSLPKCDTSALDSASGPVELTFWHALTGGELKKGLEELTAAYNTSQSKVKVKLETQGGYEDTLDKYLQTGAKSRPDIVQSAEYGFQAMRDSSTLVPVGACMKSAGYDTTPFLPTALTAYATEGVQWAMPFNLSNPVLFYNRKAFTAAGLDPDAPPASLGELVSVSRKIVESKAASYGITFDTGFDSGGGWYIEQWFAKAGVFYSDNENGRSAPSKKVLFDQPFGVELFTIIKQMVDEKIALNVGDNPSGQDALLSLVDANKPAAMTISTSAALGQVLAVVGSGAFPQVTLDDIGIAPMPGPDGKPGALAGGGALWIVDSGDAAKAAAAWDYITYLVNAQSQSTWAVKTGYVPIRTDALELDPVKTTYATDPRFKVAYQQLLDTPPGPTSVGPVIGPLKQIRITLAQALANVLTANGDPAGALAAAAAQSNTLIANYDANR